MTGGANLHHGLREGVRKCDPASIPPYGRRRAHLPPGAVDLPQGTGDGPICEISGRRGVPDPGKDSRGHIAPPPPLEQVTEGCEQIEPKFEDDEQAFVGYFEATYIGRRGPEGRRRPIFGRRIWNVDHRMTLGAHRTNNATESFHCSSARAMSQANHPAVYRFVESLQLQKNIACGAINIAPHHSD